MKFDEKKSISKFVQLFTGLILTLGSIGEGNSSEKPDLPPIPKESSVSSEESQDTKGARRPLKNLFKRKGKKDKTEATMDVQPSKEEAIPSPEPVPSSQKSAASKNPIKRLWNWAACKNKCYRHADKCKDEAYYNECLQNCGHSKKGKPAKMKKCQAVYTKNNIMSCAERENLVDSARKAARLLNTELGYNEVKERIIIGDCQTTGHPEIEEKNPLTGKDSLKEELEQAVKSRNLEQ